MRNVYFALGAMCLAGSFYFAFQTPFAFIAIGLVFACLTYVYAHDVRNELQELRGRLVKEAVDAADKVKSDIVEIKGRLAKHDSEVQAVQKEVTTVSQSIKAQQMRQMNTLYPYPGDGNVTPEVVDRLQGRM